MTRDKKLHHLPTFEEERDLKREGYGLIAGIDEAGRGPLAGPVVAAAVILPLDLDAPWLEMVRDSKQLTPPKRRFLLQRLKEEAVAIGIGMVPPELIDAQGIAPATRLAMRLAVERLPNPPQFLLVDFLTLSEVRLPQKAIKYGDALCFSIAAASIAAKVTRDDLMVEMDALYPGYGFARHKGYPTPEHLHHLQRLGVSPIHRRSFSPVRELLNRETG